MEPAWNHMNFPTRGTTPFPPFFPNQVFCCRIGLESLLLRFGVDNQLLEPLVAFAQLTQQDRIVIVPQEVHHQMLGMVKAIMQVTCEVEFDTGERVEIFKVWERFFGEPPNGVGFFEFNIEEKDIPLRLTKMKDLTAPLVCDQMDQAHYMYTHTIQIWRVEREEGEIFNGTKPWMEVAKRGLHGKMKEEYEKSVMKLYKEHVRKLNKERGVLKDRKEVVWADSKGKVHVEVVSTKD